jgi:hypothetical protein
LLILLGLPHLRYQLMLKIIPCSLNLIFVPIIRLFGICPVFWVLGSTFLIFLSVTMGGKSFGFRWLFIYLLNLPITLGGLAMWWMFSTNIDAEH